MDFKEFIQESWTVFEQVIRDYHVDNHVDAEQKNPFKKDEFMHLLYSKNWIDTVQWHLEDIVRDPEIQPEEAIKIKRRIDASNQDRTDMVEYIDAWFLNYFKDVKPESGAKINTESPAWAIDRLSILALKVYHMKEESERTDATEEHRKKCLQKLEVLLEQKQDLSTALTELLMEIAEGKKFMKVYKQMKMYNDEETNPVLYKK